MVGKDDMGLYGWKQLILWSLQHACLDEVEFAEVSTQWETKWKEFLRWLIEKYENGPKLA